MHNEKKTKHLETVLRNLRRDAPINPTYKSELWNQLLAQPVSKNRWKYRTFSAVAACVLVLALAYPYKDLTKTIVGYAQIASGETRQTPIYYNTNYDFENQSVVVSLQDGSTMTFLPYSEFCIQSPSTERRNEDVRIALLNGAVEANVAKSRPRHLFITTPNTEIKVIGTRFSVTVTKNRSAYQPN